MSQKNTYTLLTNAYISCMSKQSWQGPFHQRTIPRGVYGQPSKVWEEYWEAVDAFEQQQTLMLLVELADILGALQGYVVVDVHALWAQRSRQVSHDSTSQLLQQLQQSLTVLFDGDPTAEQILVVLTHLVSISRKYNLDFHELQAFATLRSHVARVALGETNS